MQVTRLGHPTHVSEEELPIAKCVQCPPTGWSVSATTDAYFCFSGGNRGGFNKGKRTRSATGLVVLFSSHLLVLLLDFCMWRSAFSAKRWKLFALLCDLVDAVIGFIIMNKKYEQLIRSSRNVMSPNHSSLIIMQFEVWSINDFRKGYRKGFFGHEKVRGATIGRYNRC